MRSNRRTFLYLLVLFLLCAILGGRWVWNTSYQNQLSQHQSQLDRFSSHIATKLDKYAHLPKLLAQDRDIISALLTTHNSAQIDVTNRYLEDVNQVISAADTYLLDAQGTTIAASNWNIDRSFVGRNFAWRPYFYQAMQGEASQYFALGSTSGQRGYYYSYPVVYAAEIIGVIVIKMDLSAIEGSWQSERNLFVVTDPNNIIFMSSNPKWLFHSFSDLSPQVRQQVLASRQYLDTEIRSLGLLGDLSVAQSELSNLRKGGGQGDFIVTSRPIDKLQLTIRVLTPKHTILWSTLSFLLVLTLVFAIAFLSLQLVLQKQLKQRQFEQIQSEAKQKLEFLVMERTAELHAEINERTRTEQMLRQTQNELIQAAKLAVLGQMSASISHELNNPLAAIRSFADNGRRFLAKQQTERVDDNLSRISALTERMAKISDQLKSFTRKSDSQERQKLALTPMIISVKELIAPQVKSQQASLSIDTPDTPIFVTVNPIQLEQVMVNLLTNAIQAVSDSPRHDVALTVEVTPKMVMIHTDDSGEGIEPSQRQKLFEPFYTTKKNGLGLGLSISQQILAAMDGELTISTSPLGGARFTITLPYKDK
ncbi:sensor histidine kinase [Vibrio panuliri]|uniref:histidine kinase n=1 Tax=Vibrio panuliri TaxID=1381081 RepID=A0ABX3F2Q9_9VIBR|nr:ATP-binding protein [Vibrio panuliri]KAB1453900.1 sensor histidine kinase [Vibrio panuliri]OLQ83965.1 ATPase [Vibrio panuliri]